MGTTNFSNSENNSFSVGLDESVRLVVRDIIYSICSKQTDRGSDG